MSQIITKLKQQPGSSKITSVWVSYYAHPQQICHCERNAAISPSSQESSSVTMTRLTPWWYIKRTMREIASYLPMTVGADGFSNSVRHGVFRYVEVKSKAPALHKPRGLFLTGRSLEITPGRGISLVIHR